MSEFDKEVVLERILNEAPIKMIKKGTIEVDGKQRVIYSHYFNRGVEDPDLPYDRKGNPEKTSVDSSLAEIYEGWEHAQGIVETKQRLVEGGEFHPDDTFYNGPWIDNCMHDPVQGARLGARYLFSAGHYFADHLNNICDDLGYEVRLDEEGETLLVSRQITFEHEGMPQTATVTLNAKLPFNLHRKDPTLGEVLSAVDSAYQTLKEMDLDNAQIYLDTSKAPAHI